MAPKYNCQEGKRNKNAAQRDDAHPAKILFYLVIMTINTNKAFNPVLYVLEILIFVIFKNPMRFEILDQFQLFGRGQEVSPLGIHGDGKIIGIRPYVAKLLKDMESARNPGLLHGYARLFQLSCELL